MNDAASDPGRAPSSAAASGGGLADDGAAAGALDRVLREPDFRERLAREAKDLLQLGALLERGVRGELSRGFCLRLAEEAERVESALLDVGARGNRAHAFLAETVTGLRWAARGLHALLHLRGRIRRYLGDRADLETFRRGLDTWIAWLVARLSSLLAAVRAEAKGALGPRVPEQPYDAGLLAVEEARWRLPQDVGVGESVDERERIAELAGRLVILADEIARLPRPDADDPEALREHGRTVFSASAAEQVQARIHEIQSAYDSAVAATSLEAADPQLKVLRGYVSILLHLVEGVAYLLQWNARLDGDARLAAVRPRIAELVDDVELRQWTLGFGLPNTALCFAEARVAAQAVVDTYSTRRDVVFALPPGRKLHLRPAGLIVRVVQHHGLPVQMRMGDQDVDARQLMDVILLAASHPNETHVRFRGDEKVVADLHALFEHRLGEDGLDGFPPSLSYLRSPARPPGR